MSLESDSLSSLSTPPETIPAAPSVSLASAAPTAPASIASPKERRRGIAIPGSTYALARRIAAYRDQSVSAYVAELIRADPAARRVAAELA